MPNITIHANLTVGSPQPHAVTLRSQRIFATTAVCPASNITYAGDCPNIECPANLSLLTGGVRTGCFHKYGKPELETIAQVINLPLKEVKARYASGLRGLELIIAFVNVVNDTRQRSYETSEMKSCQHCGINRLKVGDCLNTKRCHQRLHLAHKAMRKYPMNIPELKISQFDFWRVVKHQMQDEEFPCIFSPAIMAQAETLMKRL